MKFWHCVSFALGGLLLVLTGTGCSGLDATGTVSPLMFLVPGLGQTSPVGPPVALDPAPSPDTTPGQPI